MTGLVIVAARARSFSGALILTVVAGSVFWIFDWWYSKPVFGWAFLVGLIWLGLISSRDFKRVALQAILFAAISGLGFQSVGFNAESTYLSNVLSYEADFSNAVGTITELRQVAFAEILSRISGSVWLGGFSVVGLAFWGLRHPHPCRSIRAKLQLSHYLIFIGNRAIFYSAPMLWFGFGWILFTAAKVVNEKLKKDQFRNIIFSLLRFGRPFRCVVF